jgi:pyrophosphatase PpaX
VTRELKVLEIEDLFGDVVCNEDVVRKKPHPEGLRLALRHLDKKAESCCYVGDSPADMEMGKRTGGKTIGIRSGYPSSRVLPGTNPDLFFDSIIQLRDHFRL